MTLMTNFLNSARDAIKADMETDFSHGAIGTGTTAPTAGDTTLETEVLRKATQETSEGTNTKTISAWIGSGEANGNDITEFGFISAAAGGSLWNRNTFAAKSKTSDIELWFDVEVTISVVEG